MAKLSDAELASQYGLSAAMINSSKELKALFKKAVAGGWTAGRFTASLKNTKWWSTQPDVLRQYLTLRYTDPATYRQQRDATGAAVRDLAIQAGVAADVLARGGKWTPLLSDLVYKKMALGWSDARITEYAGARAQLHGDVMYGAAGEAFDQLNQLAYANGITKSAVWYRQAARSIVSGHSTLEGQEAAIRREAAAKYSAFADQIKAGQNVMDLASPYIQSVSKILEIPDSDVDLSNKHVAKAMTMNKGGQAQSIWAFENELRQDPTWRKTQNAQDSTMQTAHQVLMQMGMVF
jgi:hypothetical protein